MNWKKDVFTVPNFLSLFRLTLIPVYLSIYLQADRPEDHFLAASILTVSCLTDLIDGKIARRFHMVSTLGKFLDPLADKLTQFTLGLCLANRYPVLRYVVVLLFVKEIFQLIAAWIHLRQGRMLPGALMSGKVCTTVLFVSLILLVLLPKVPEPAVNAVAAIDAGFLLFTFLCYVMAFHNIDPRAESC